MDNMFDSNHTTNQNLSTTESPRPSDEQSRRSFLHKIIGGSLFVTGCSSLDSDTNTPVHESTSPVGGRETSELINSALKDARTELNLAFMEIQSNNLVDSNSQVWTPNYQDLGNMDRDKVIKHISSARQAILRASNPENEGEQDNIRIKLLKNVAETAKLSSDFYYSFALTFEKIYQYEYLIQSVEDYSRGAEKMRNAQEELTEWSSIGSQLEDTLNLVKEISDWNRRKISNIESFNLAKWDHVAFGAREYSHRMEPRLKGFENYATSYAADLTGIEALDNSEFQEARREFITAQEKIIEAKRTLEEAENRGDSFFEPRASALLKRIPLFEEGFLLHIDAADALAEGKTKKADDLEFRGTTKIRNAFALHPVDDGDSSKPTPDTP